MAATIVLAEVPSGAFTDTLGRKKLVVLSSAIMFIEKATIAFVPTGNLTSVFIVFLVNRVISGLAMALASGADEALAYDTLQESGKEDVWPHVLQIKLRIASGVGIFVTLLGAAMCDIDFMSSLYNVVGFVEPESTQDIMRIPVYATLIVELIAIYAAINMQEDQKTYETHSDKWASIQASLKFSDETITHFFAFLVYTN